MTPLAYFGIESSGFSLAVSLLILFLVVLYLALIYWTYQDARRRIDDPVMVALSTFVALFPFVGPIIYMVLRPPEYLEDVRERDLELANAEARAQQFHRLLCPYCSYRIERDFVRCPSCLRKLKERCVNCSRPLDQAWTICPYCEADVPGVSTPRVRRRRGSGLDGEIAEYERPLAPEGEPEAALTASEPSQSAAELRSERRATDRRAASTARAAAATRRPRPAP